MIMHVAEAGEQRGRVVLHITSGHPNEVAMEAAVRIAQAFHSEIESLFVEDLQLYDMASYPFALEISLTGARRTLSRDAIERDLQLTARGLRRRLGLESARPSLSSAARGGTGVDEAARRLAACPRRLAGDQTPNAAIATVTGLTRPTAFSVIDSNRLRTASSSGALERLEPTSRTATSSPPRRCPAVARR